MTLSRHKRPVEKTLWLLTAAPYLLCLMAGTPSTGVAQNQAFPTKPVRIINTVSAGGPADVIARILAQKLTESWGQQVIVDTRPGAAGTIGAEIVARAPPDGYTLLLG